jgi:4-amino-4-deoxy-L-arabinose transferase-like glycosyltransferase
VAAHGKAVHRLQPKHLRYHLDLAILGLLLLAFVLVISQRLGAVPLPETDEAYTLQVPYEMIFHGKLALPMLRYLGGNIENVWHSYTPVYFVILGGFFKLTGWGLLQGRVFNVMTAILLLVIVYVTGRRLFDWRAALVATVMLLSDITFVERSRMLRNDYLAAFFAVLGFYLYEVARQRQQDRYYIASGLAVGCGVMCHTNVLYMLGAVCLLILLSEGRQAFRKRPLYEVTAGALAVMAYEIVYDLIDYKNFRLQNRDDKLHFMLFEPGGLWQNLVGEFGRYRAWYTARSQFAGIHYGLIFPDLPRTLLHVFQLLALAAIIYLAVVTVARIRRKQAMSDDRVQLFVVTLSAVLFHALVTSHKEIYYMAHLVPWFALAVGVMLCDGQAAIARIRFAPGPRAKLIYKAATVVALAAALAYGALLIRQYKKYYNGLRNPALVNFDEYEATLKEIIPADLCPVVERVPPAVWLAFPEKDACFADIEKRMRKFAEAPVDIDGKEFALITPVKRDDYHLIGELKGTAYGPEIYIYYTGADPRLTTAAPKTYELFGWQKGHVLEPPGDQPSTRDAHPSRR